MLSILMVASHIFPIPAVMGGSIETLIQYFLEENIKKQRIKLTVYSVDDQSARKVYSEQYREADIVYIKRTGLDKLWDKLWPINRAFLKVFKRIMLENPYIKKVCKDIEGKDFDYIIFEGNYYEKCGLIFRKVGRDKLIIHWHTEMQGREIMNKWFFRHICISNYVARVLICNGYIRPEDALVLRNCVNIDLFSQSLTAAKRGELLSRYNIDENDFVISFVGRIIPEKGARELLLAFKEICNSNAGCKLLIIGSSGFGYEDRTAYQAELENIAEELKEKVVFTGFLHHDEMWKFLKLSSVSVFPSIWNEGAGMVAMEVMAASIPLIAFNVGGVPEYVDKNASILIDWDKNIVRQLSDSITALMGDKGKQAEMSARGYDYVQKYTISKYYDDFCDILYEIDRENVERSK